jgi:hypothetical protein
MPEDAIELPEYGDASAPTDAAGEAGHAVDSSHAFRISQGETVYEK